MPIDIQPPRATRRTPSGSADEGALKLELFLPYRLLIVTDLITKIFEVRYRTEFGISIPESRILNVLSRFAPISSREISELTTLTKPSVSTAISRLVAAGLLTRNVNCEDKRLLHIDLTDKGRALQRRIVPVALEIERALSDALRAGGRDKLMDLLSAIERWARAHLKIDARAASLASSAITTPDRRKARRRPSSA